MINKSTISEVFIGLIEDNNNGERFPGWSSGDNLDHTNWHTSPTAVISNGNACVAKKKSVDGQWVIVNCFQAMPYICKRKGMTHELRMHRCT